MSNSPKNRVVMRLKYPDGVIRYFCNAFMDPAGCIVYDSTSGSTGDKFWEPRLTGGQIAQDCGNLSEGIPKQVFQTVILTADPKGRGDVDLISDFSSHRIEGANVQIWYGLRSETSVSNLTRVFIGTVPFTGAYSYSYRTGLIQLKIQSAITIDGVLSTETYSAFEVTSSNNTILLSEGGGVLTATLTIDKYSADEMVVEFQRSLNAAGSLSYTASYDSTTGKFTISAGSNFTIYWSNASTTAESLLGFNAVDDTGASSYTSDNAVSLGFPDSLNGTIKPLSFGMKGLGTSPTGFPIYAFLIEDDGSLAKVSIGGLPSSFQYEQPTAVRVDGVAATGPSAGTPAGGQWGNWNSSAGTFEIKDGAGIHAQEDAIIVVETKGLKDITTSVVGVGDVLSSIFEACGYSAGATPQADFSRSVNDAWAATLSNGFDKLYGVWPFRAQTSPVNQIDIFTEIMRRTGSILRINTAGNYRFEPVFPWASSTPDYTFIAEDIVDLVESLDPSGEYANQTVTNGIYANYVSDKLQSSTATDGSEVTAVGATVQQVVNFPGVRVPNSSGCATAINTLHSQKIRITQAQLGAAAAGILPGHRVKFDWRSVNDHLGVGHVRSMTLDLQRGIYTIKSYHILNS